MFFIKHSVISCSGPPMVSWRNDIVVCIKVCDYFFTEVVLDKKKKKKKISHRHWGPLRASSSPFFGPLSRRGLNRIKPVYDLDWPDGRLDLTASTFNQLGQYASSPGRRDYCYAELSVFFPSGGRNHRQYSLCLPTYAPWWKTIIKWLLSVSAVPQCSRHLSLVLKPYLYAHSHCYEPTIPCVSDAHEG